MDKLGEITMIIKNINNVAICGNIFDSRFYEHELEKLLKTAHKIYA